MKNADSMQLKKDDTCHWEGALTIQRVVALKEELFKALDRLDTILIDITNATEIDPACMQLLCSAHRSATQLKKDLSLIGGEHLAKTIREAGFARHVGCSLDCNHSCLWVDHNSGPGSSVVRKDDENG